MANPPIPQCPQIPSILSIHEVVRIAHHRILILHTRLVPCALSSTHETIIARCGELLGSYAVILELPLATWRAYTGRLERSLAETCYSRYHFYPRRCFWELYHFRYHLSPRRSVSDELAPSLVRDPGQHLLCRSYGYHRHHLCEPLRAHHLESAYRCCRNVPFAERCLMLSPSQALNHDYRLADRSVRSCHYR